MARRTPIALTLSASLFVAPLGALAQTPAPQTSPAAPSPQSPAPMGSPLAQPVPTTTAPAAPVASPGAAQPVVGGNVRGGGNPPPPVPAVLPAVPNIEQGFTAPVSATPNADLVGVQQQPFVGLTLQNAIAMALQRNTDLAVAQSNRAIANYQIVAAQGAYDVRFQLVPSYQHSVSPAVSSFQAGPGGGPVTQDTAGVTAALQGMTQRGTQYRVGVVGSRITNDSTVNSYDPFYETALQLSVTQPLARGRATDPARLQIALARDNAAISNSTALSQASNTVVQVSNAYYDLVAAWRNVAIQEEGLRQATAQAQSNARLARQGAVAPTDIVEANTQVDVFQDNVFSAIQNVQRLQTALKSLLLANPADPVWFANLVPTSAIAQIPSEPSLDALIASAIANRPEIAQLRAQRSSAGENLAYAKDQLKPQIDLGLGYTSNGFAGVPTDPSANPIFGLFGAQISAINALIARSNAANPNSMPIPPIGAAGLGASPTYQNGRFGQSVTNLLDNRFPTYSAQVTLQIPLGNRTARADYAIAQEREKQVGVQETALLQRIRSEAVNAIQGLREAQYRVTAASSARAASERVLAGEQRRFQAGASTTFLVLQRQLDVANQRGRELQAQTDLDKAIVELERVGGGIFAQNGIDVEQLGRTTIGGVSPTSALPSPAPTVTAPPVRRRPL